MIEARGAGLGGDNSENAAFLVDGFAGVIDADEPGAERRALRSAEKPIELDLDDGLFVGLGRLLYLFDLTLDLRARRDQDLLTGDYRSDDDRFHGVFDFGRRA